MSDFERYALQTHERVGPCLRREADEWIERGWVQVDGAVAILGLKVLPNQTITIDPRARKEQARRLTVILHKPMAMSAGRPKKAIRLPRAADAGESVARGQGVLGKTRGTAAGVPATRGAKAGPLRRQDLWVSRPRGASISIRPGCCDDADGRVAKLLIGEDSEIEKEYLVRVRYTRSGKLPAENLRA